MSASNDEEKAVALKLRMLEFWADSVGKEINISFFDK